ncbi:hypothetical protein GQ53DRAFT_56832 [Thozetella sp. PMI_491]|nr:hypothetical protein GQ53DRAFT_56832 [Thozetella sp. PMI_491]
MNNPPHTCTRTSIIEPLSRLGGAVSNHCKTSPSVPRGVPKTGSTPRNIQSPKLDQLSCEKKLPTPSAILHFGGGHNLFFEHAAPRLRRQHLVPRAFDFTSSRWYPMGPLAGARRLVRALTAPLSAPFPGDDPASDLATQATGWAQRAEEIELVAYPCHHPQIARSSVAEPVAEPAACLRRRQPSLSDGRRAQSRSSSPASSIRSDLSRRTSIAHGGDAWPCRHKRAESEVLWRQYWD